MKTPLDLAIEHARAFVRDRRRRTEPLTREEVAEILRTYDSAERYTCSCPCTGECAM